MFSEKSILKFWSKVDKSGKCWLWKGATIQGRSGSVRINGKHYYAHQVAFFLARGRFPEGVTRHSCDVSLCMNDEHMLEGTQLQNMKDRQERKRHTNDKLDDEQARELRSLWNLGVTYKELGFLFGIKPNSVYKIINNKRHKEPALVLAEAAELRG